MSELHREQAADWYARLRGDASSPQDHAEFEVWLAADRAHRLAYAEVAALGFACEQCADVDNVRVRAPLRAAPWLRGRAWWFGAVTALCLALGLPNVERGWVWLRADQVSGSGEVREIALADGSRLWLGADSAAAVRYGEDERRVELLRGELFVEVEPNPARPFSVVAGKLSARAVGTSYAVALRPGDVVDVAVQTGTVAVVDASSEVALELVAGQRTRAAAGRPLRAEAVDGDVAAWRDGLLVFEDAPLLEVVQRIDAQLPQAIVLFGGANASQPVTALIPTADAEAGLQALADAQGLRLYRVPGLIVLSD